MTEYRLTPTAQLIDLRLQDMDTDGVVETVRRLDKEHGSWRLVARELSDLAGMRVTHETVRQWAIEWRIEGNDKAAA